MICRKTQTMKMNTKATSIWAIKRKNEEGRVEIYTEVIPNCKAITLRPIILGKVDLDESILYSDGWRAYDGLVDVESERHFRVNH